MHSLTAPCRGLTWLAAPLAVTLLTSCGAAGAGPGPAGSPAADTTPKSDVVELGQATPRLALTYDGGVMVLDGASLELLETVELDGFNRLNPAGDGRHVMISTGSAFKVLDTGSWSEAHGDHAHHYATTPSLTSVEFVADEPGHVVSHAGRTVLFSDGSGVIESFDPPQLADGQPETETYTAAEAHHGVAVELKNGNMLLTVGNSTSRSGLVLLDEDRREITRNEQCPGVHGEATASEEAVTVGCENGALVYREGKITKVDSPDTYGRMGNQKGSEESTVVLADYKTDPDAELERPERIALIDTSNSTVDLVELGTSYSFRSLGRGLHGEALVLGTDGSLHVIGPASGAVTASIPVIDEWEEPVEWQQPRPTLAVQGHTAYVTDPGSSSIHAVDLESGDVIESAELPHVPNELTGAGD